MCAAEKPLCYRKKSLIHPGSSPIVLSIKTSKTIGTRRGRAAKAMTIGQRTIEQRADVARGEVMETLASLLYDDLTVTEVIRPAAVLSETNARIVLDGLRTQDVSQGGHWHAEPGCWRLYEHPWAGARESADDRAGLIGSIQVAYGMPSRYEITIFRATITVAGSRCGYTVTSLCDEALSFAGLTLSTCPRIDLPAPPQPFRMR